MHGLAVYAKEVLPLARDVSLENSAGSYLCFRFLLLHSLPYFFYHYRSLSSLLCTVFDSISSNINEVLLINSSANVFFFGDLNVHYKAWLTHSGGSDRPGELCYNFFLSQMTLLKWLTFLLGSLTVSLTVLLFWISFFLLTLAFVLQCLSFHLEILIMLLSQFPFTFQ